MVEQFNFTTKGTCSRAIVVAVEDGIIRDVKFVGGCPGNQLGIGVLVKDRPISEVAELLRGIRCGNKSTSCPDQLALALESIASKK
ncbi:MAG: TIGR03905 family TSCPD domain-containing protein [Victivallaceae bacterium]|nr:TIGR03905 family TSCPD domain-containing protein [Victivallaceae bacterium]